MPVTLTTIDLGDACRLLIKVRDPGTDALTDVASGITVTATGPSGQTVTGATNHLSTGVYESVFTPDASGAWLAKVLIGGAAAAVEYGRVRVRATPT